MKLFRSDQVRARRRELTEEERAELQAQWRVSPGKVSGTSRMTSVPYDVARNAVPVASSATAAEGITRRRWPGSDVDHGALFGMTRSHEPARPMLGTGREAMQHLAWPRRLASVRVPASGAAASAPIQRKALDEHSGPVELKLETTAGGTKLPEEVRAKMEAALGMDFSGVRIHVGEQAPSMGALAFTRGADIFFAPGRYQPWSREGQELIGHELAHVVQQAQGRVSSTRRMAGVALNDETRLEKEADEMGARVVGPSQRERREAAMPRREGGVRATASAVIQRHDDHEGLSDNERYEHTLTHAHTTRAAWDAGYVSNARLLGVRIQRGVHQELLDRLVIAERYLREQFPGLSDREIAGRVNLYSVSGRRPVRNAVGGSTLSLHSYGLAIDVNYRGNPFIGRSRAVDTILNRASEFISGNSFHIRNRQAGNLVQIRNRYQQASDDLRAYFAMRENRAAVAAKLGERGLPQTEQAVTDQMQRIQNDYRSSALLRDFATTDPHNPRDPAQGFIDLNEQLVVALGQEAGLQWGGQYRVGKDMMHFDWRRGTIRPRHRV